MWSMFRLLVVLILLLGLVSSNPSKTGVRDCSDKEGLDEIARCRLDQVKDHIESKKYGDRLRKLNQDLDSWAGKQEKEIQKLIRNMDRNLQKIQDRGPVASLVGDLARIIGVVAGIPFRAANIIFRDLLGLNKFWSDVLTSFWTSYCIRLVGEKQLKYKLREPVNK